MKTETKTVRANGIDIHYIERGSGTPLVLLHGGMVTTNPTWTGHPLAYGSHLEAFAEHFRVIAPDTRGAGRTRHVTGSVAFDVLADDVLGLIDALQLHRPKLCGFSEGGTTATIAGIRRPGAVGAIVNDAGYDLFNPESPSFAMMRQMLGGTADAREANPEAMRRAFDASEQMRATFRLMQADQDDAQGAGHWKKYLHLAYDRLSRRLAYGFGDLRAIAAPTLILVGDRDQFCTPEEGVAAFRALERGELAIMPNTGHVITEAKVRASIEFLRRSA
ncbi:MAG TPA: alpha/beta hydrolase [Polyangiales bacterium]|nr:alpha/beta hydrolase [Polyangiales bacterium]